MASEGQDDPNRARVAPPPPPPARGGADIPAAGKKGFDPKGHRLLVEVAVAVAAIVVLGASLVFAGGRIAAWLTPLVPWSFDQKLGELASSQFAAQAPACTHPAAQKYVEELAAPLVAAAGDLPFEFTFRVADTEDVNAFALPGGFVTVNYGLLTAADTGEEVAGVIGHEIQHALLRHGTKRMLRQMGGAALLAMLFGGSDVQTLAYGAAQLAGLSYDRGQESEADQRGVELLVAAGIDPSGFSDFFERLAQDSLTPPALLSTHPDPGDRAALVAKATKQAGEFRALPSPRDIPCHAVKPGKSGPQEKPDAAPRDASATGDWK